MPGVTIGTNMKTRMRLVTFKEMREIQRIIEASNVGPGSTDYLKPFGSDVPQKVNFGRRRSEKVSENPGPGSYDANKADKHIMLSGLP